MKSNHRNPSWCRCLGGAFCLAVVLFVSLWTSAGWAATYYIDPNGSDQTGDGSSSKPWKSLSYACGRVTAAGNTIHVNAGNYMDNNSCNYKPGVKIEGAGKDVVRITTSHSWYIDGNSGTPVVNGSNEISGISFFGAGSNMAVSILGRSNVKVHDCHFEGFDPAVRVAGKVPTFSLTCNPAPTSTAVCCDDDHRLSTEPGATDWAEGVEIYNNVLIDSRMIFHTIKNSNIYNNTIDNSNSLKSGVGHTSYWWNGVDFYSNTIRMKTLAWGSIALEVWMVEGNTRFRDNWTNGWFSVVKNPTGPKTPYSWQILNNTFESNVPRGEGSTPAGCALETCYFVENALIEGNFFINTGANKSYLRAIAVWGYGVNKNIIIRNNIFKDISSDAIFISSADTQRQLFDGDDIHIYNNVFDNVNGGSGQGVALIDGAGDIDNVYIKNNIFMTVDRGAFIYPSGHSVTNVAFTNNVVYNAKGLTLDSGSGGFSLVQNNFTSSPGLNYSGALPSPYYEPAGASSNLVDKGVNVGIEYSGAAPDIGAYEFVQSLLQPPQNLRYTPR